MDKTDSRAAVQCPHCGKAVSPEEQFCPHCGVNLGLAAALAAQQVSVPLVPNASTGDLAPDALVPRLGERLVQAGMITSQQLEHALAYQRERAQAGAPLRLGQALVALGFIDRDVLDRVVAEIILQLQNALRQANARLERKVTERTRQLRKALERLSELQRLKANFLANVSHELRTPLTHLVGYLDLMDEGALGDLTAEQKQAIDVMQRSAERLLYLIEDLISFSLLTRGSLAVEIKATSVDEVVSSALTFIEPRVKAKGMTFVKEISPSLWVLADGDKVGWALQHLLDNAVKFTPTGGTITLRVWSDGSRVHFLVADTGIGIAQENLQLIFEPFLQLEDASRRHYGGTGLGLALVKQILDAHDARLRVTSEPGSGTAVQFALEQTVSDGDASGLQ